MIGFPSMPRVNLVIPGIIDAFPQSAKKLRIDTHVFEFHYNQIGGSSPLTLHFSISFFLDPICAVRGFRMMA